MEDEETIGSAMRLLDYMERCAREAVDGLPSDHPFVCLRVTRRELRLGLGGVTARALDDGRVRVEVRRTYSSGAHSYTSWPATSDKDALVGNVEAAITDDAEAAIAMHQLRAKRIVAPSTN